MKDDSYRTRGAGEILAVTAAAKSQQIGGEWDT